MSRAAPRSPRPSSTPNANSYLNRQSALSAASATSTSAGSAYEDAGKLSTNGHGHQNDEDPDGALDADALTVTGTAESSTANSSPNPSWKPRTPNGPPPPSSHSHVPPAPSQTPASASPAPPPFSLSFWDPNNAAVARARRAYVKLYLPGVFYITFIILAVLSLFWGTLFHLPGRAVNGIIVDFDGGPIGTSLTSTIQSLEASSTSRRIVSWTYLSLPAAQVRFPGGVEDVRRAIENQAVFAAVAVSPGASARLVDAVGNPGGSGGYDGSGAVTAFASEGRNENAYRTYLFPHLVTMLNTFQRTFALQFAAQQSASLSAENLQRLMQTAPQTLVQPAGFTIVNVLPFYQPIATAPVFTGLIFVLILAFFTVLVANGARVGSGLNRLLTLRSLVLLRLGSAAGIYLFFSLLYSLLNLMFGVRLTHTFGHAGFILFWLGTWIYMLGVGLVLESWVVLFKANTPFFFFPWLVVNLSVGVYPLEMLPRFYRYGYGSPYYNTTRIVRTIVFGTRNTLGLNFGVLIAWVVFGTLNMIAVQWYVRRQDVMALRAAAAKAGTSSSTDGGAGVDLERAKGKMAPGMETAAVKS